MLAFSSKCQKWKEQVKVSWYRKIGDFILKSVEIVQFENKNNRERMYRNSAWNGRCPPNLDPMQIPMLILYKKKNARLCFGFKT